MFSISQAYYSYFNGDLLKVGIYSLQHIVSFFTALIFLTYLSRRLVHEINADNSPSLNFLRITAVYFICNCLWGSRVIQQKRVIIILQIYADKSNIDNNHTDCFRRYFKTEPQGVATRISRDVRRLPTGQF